ncbi:MAG TPA: ribonuclease H-like domain-containing protein [Chitinophagales bacterium]|nr:ribonuclease H-like domain-containing protein [Chitinophagales bacterium]
MDLIRFSLNRILFIDIETVSSSHRYSDLSSIEQELWEEKRGRYRAEGIDPADYYFNNAGIFAEFGKIICISLGYFSKQEEKRVFKVKSISDHDEAKLLNDFVQVLNQFEKSFGNQLVICGHNVREFDLPYICRRLVVHGMISNFPPFFMKIQMAKPWELTSMILDTLDTWRFGDYKNYISLKLYTHVLGIPSPKDDIDGSEVGKVYYEDNDLNRIRIYCEKDVVSVAAIILKLKGMPPINSDEIIISSE